MKYRKYECELPALDKKKIIKNVAYMNLIGLNSEKENHEQILMEPRHISEVKQVLKCLAIQKCDDLIRIWLRLTGISDFQAKEREQQEKLILSK